MTKRGSAGGARLPRLAMLIAGAALLPVPFVAAGLSAQPMVQAVPVQPAGQALNIALARLARDPRDLAALIDAGNAALVMGDVDAATGFFARADQLSPNNMRVKAGLAGALVRSENPYDAIPLFAEAERAGAVDPLLAADRGLAYDLVGDNANAQKYYRQALAVAQSDETVRRLALSQAIAGDRKGMEATLSPLLQRQDKGAWRTRAFALAILGAPEEAVTIANQTMPAELANGIAPYLRFMPRLTPAQQAAAANLGRFPRAAEVGRDDPRVALYAPPRRVAGNVGAGLVPAGEPLGRGRARPAERRQERVAVAPVRAAPPEPAPARSDGLPPEIRPAALANPAPRMAVVAPLPQRPQATAPSVRPSASSATTASLHASPDVSAPAQTAVGIGALVRSDVAAPAPAPSLSTPPALPASVPARAPAPLPAEPPRTAAVAGPDLAPGGGFDLARVGPPAAVPASAAPPAVRVAAPAPAAVAPQPAQPPSAPAAPKPRPRRLADAFADLAVVPKAPAAPAPGAVDVRKLAEARARAEAAARIPPKPAHPSRIWVQVGTGRDTGALGFTWRGLIKDSPALFKGQSASISDWGRTNRLLAGPFSTEAAAEAFLAKARKAGLDAFVWTSPAGQVVDALPSR